MNVDRRRSATVVKAQRTFYPGAHESLAVTLAFAENENCHSFDPHARIEAIKDGLTEIDLRHTLEYGEQREDYPERARALLLGWTKDRIPCHSIVEWDTAVSPAVIVSAYVPNRQDWYPDWKRRRRRKRP